MTRIGTTVVAICLLAFGVWLYSSDGRAQSLFETLVMPGPLIEGHADLERECAKCHLPYVRQSQSKLCLDCHKDIAADRAQNRGFHGRDRTAASSDCKQCHTDHKGRSIDVVKLDRETFNHEVTNFQLTGAHTSVRCDGCHPASEKYRKAASACVECHRAVEPHKGRLGTNCQDCHTDKTWRLTKKFDHSKTKFPLVGTHREVACSACHANEKYKGVGLICVACHGVQDKHAGRYGTKCETCHAPNKWATISFNHDKATKFPLRGKHAAVKCDTCHTGDLYRDKLATNCAACHQKNDVHKGQLGSRCEQCHTETGWRQKVAFDHDITRFPLIGLHAGVACEECHRTQRFKDTPQTCSSCHKDTHHEGRLGTQCALCHNPNGWQRWRFDHTKQTHYPLTGAHQGLNCHACHTAQVRTKVTLSTNCYACHSSDDAHRGSFGQSCEQCHTTSSFQGKGRQR